LAAGPSWVGADIPDPFVLGADIAVDIELVDTGVAHRVAVVVGHTEVARMPHGMVAVVGDTVQEAECSRNRRIEP